MKEGRTTKMDFLFNKPCFNTKSMVLQPQNTSKFGALMSMDNWLEAHKL